RLRYLLRTIPDRLLGELRHTSAKGLTNEISDWDARGLGGGVIGRDELGWRSALLSLWFGRRLQKGVPPGLRDEGSHQNHLRLQVRRYLRAGPQYAHACMLLRRLQRVQQEDVPVDAALRPSEDAQGACQTRREGAQANV